MDAFVKSFSVYRTIKKASVISSALIIDSLESEASTVTVTGTEIGDGDTGNWMIIDGMVYLISQVKPQKDRTIITLLPPLDAFKRPLELAAQSASQTVGGFVSRMLTDNWTAGDDPVYAVPYLVVSNSDTTGFVAPELDNSGCFRLPDYCRLMRRSYHVAVRFEDSGGKLSCTIGKEAVSNRKVSFEDGRSQLQSADFSSSGVAKLTVLCDISTGEKDEAGNAVTVRERSVWYLSEDGNISREVPARRAVGEWKTIQVKGAENVETKVIEAFAKNKTSHKLEFWSELDLQILDNCTFLVYGNLLQSHISCKRKSNNDNRYYYKSGELATTATEKLRGVAK